MQMMVDLLISDLDNYYAESLRENISDYTFYSMLAKYGLKLKQNHKLLNNLISNLITESANLQSTYLTNAKAYIKLAKYLGDDLVKICEQLYPEYSALDLPIPTAIEDVRTFVNRSEQELLKRDITYFSAVYGEVLCKIFEKLDDRKCISAIHLEYDLSEVSSLFNYDSRICVAPMIRNKLSGLCEDVATLWTDYENRRNEEVWWAHYQIDRISSGFYDKSYPTIYPSKLMDETSEVDKIYDYEIKQVSRGVKPLFLRRDKYLEYLTRMHHYLIPRIKQLIDTPLSSGNNYEYHENQLHLYGRNRDIVGTVTFVTALKVRHLFECFFCEYNSLGKTIFNRAEILSEFNRLDKDVHTWSYVSKLFPKLRKAFKVNEQATKIIHLRYLNSFDSYEFRIEKSA